MTAGIDSAYPAPRSRWWMVGVFAFAGLMSYTDRVVLSALVDPIRRDLVISDSRISLLQGAAFAIVYVLAGLPFGRLADRSTRIRLIVVGATVWSAGTILCGLAPSFWTLFAARIMVGIGEAALAPAAVSMISDCFPPTQRGTAVGVFLTGMVAGGPTAVAVGGVLLGAGQGGVFSGWPIVGTIAPWRAVLLLIGGAGLLVPCLGLTIREPVRRELGVQGALPLGEVVRRFSSQRAGLAPLYLGLALLSIGDYGILSWMPTLLSRRFAFKPVEIGALFGLVSALGGIVGSVVGGVLSDAAERFGGTRARLGAVAVAALIAAGGAGLVAASSSTEALAGLGIWTFASNLAGTGGMAALGVVVPNEIRGVSISLVAFCNTLLGLGFGPTLVALTTERVYHDPVAVGLAMATTIVPAGVLGAIMFARSSRVLGRVSA